MSSESNKPVEENPADDNEFRRYRDFPSGSFLRIFTQAVLLVLFVTGIDFLFPLWFPPGEKQPIHRSGWIVRVHGNEYIPADLGMYGMMISFAQIFAYLAFMILWLIFIYRCWAVIQDGKAFMLPETAIWILFLPFVNAVWIFVVQFLLFREMKKYCARQSVVLPKVGSCLVWITLFVQFALVLRQIGVEFGSPATKTAIRDVLLVLNIISMSVYYSFLAWMAETIQGHQTTLKRQIDAQNPSP